MVIGSRGKNSKQFHDLKMIEYVPYPKPLNLPKLLNEWFEWRYLLDFQHCHQDSEPAENFEIWRFCRILQPVSNWFLTMSKLIEFFVWTFPTGSAVIDSLDLISAFYHPRNSQSSDYCRRVEDHFESFIQVYAEHFERLYGFSRPYLQIYSSRVRGQFLIAGTRLSNN